MDSAISKYISIPKTFALGILSKRTLTLTSYLSELELIHGQTHWSAIKTFQFPFKTKTVTYMRI